jgi:hypothetical protein
MDYDERLDASDVPGVIIPIADILDSRTFIGKGVILRLRLRVLFEAVKAALPPWAREWLT